VVAPELPHDSDASTVRSCWWPPAQPSSLAHHARRPHPGWGRRTAASIGTTPGPATPLPTQPTTTPPLTTTLGSDRDRGWANQVLVWPWLWTMGLNEPYPLNSVPLNQEGQSQLQFSQRGQPLTSVSRGGFFIPNPLLPHCCLVTVNGQTNKQWGRLNLPPSSQTASRPHKGSMLSWSALALAA